MSNRRKHRTSVVKPFDLLDPSRIDVALSDEYMMEPEQSTSAIILHHPDARYFGFR